MPDVQIKRFELVDKDALLSFLRIAYPAEPRKSDPTFWNWHLLENPYTSPEDVPLWIIRSGGQVVGQVATIPVTVKVGEEERRAIWVLDFIVHSDYRGKGLGKRLVLAARESYPTMLTLGINEQSMAVFRSLKWVALGSIHRYHRLLFPGHAFGEVSRFGVMRKVFNLCHAPFRPRLAQLPQKENGALRRVSKFDTSFDVLWQRACVQWPCAVVRDSTYLEWQFMQQPGKRFDVLGLYDKTQLVGYVVLFFRKPDRSTAPPKAAITDLCYDANSSLEIIDELLKAALRLALERRAGSLVTDVLNPRVEDRLRHFGFWRIKNSPQFMASTTEHRDLIYDARNWFLTRADSDVSIFEEPNL